jgi:retinol-binding protein 3
MYRVSKDEHLRMRFSEQPHIEATDDAARLAERDAYRKHCENIACGIARVERLPGNVGYIDIREFVDPVFSGDAIAAAMTLVAYTDALIFDLRECVGGDPAAVAMFSSYLFDHRAQLSSIVSRNGTVEQFWTHEWVSGKRFGQVKPIYVLTAHFTFSGAENFAYDLKQLKRATLIGEKTGGGAHPGNLKWVTPHFNMFVPNARSVSPITQTNWEGTGVEPDVLVAKEDALRVAIEKTQVR